MNGIRIVENEKYGLPFSFFNIVFINPKFHTQDDLPEILAHENVHIRENHWFDLLFIELLTVIFWFNPFIWFFERSIKQNHEYLADKGVLAQGHNAGRYQALLINQLMGMQIIGITNNLNFALNKNRFKMMTKTRTSRIGGVKFAWALPVVALLLFAFAEPAYQQKAEGEHIVEKVNTISAIQKNDKELVIHGTVKNETGEPLPGASIVIQGTTVGTVSDRDGTFTLTYPNPKVDDKTGMLTSKMVISFVGKETLVSTISVSGNPNDGIIRFSGKLKDAVILLNNELPPPPPPARSAVPANGKTPPPPPTVLKIVDVDKESNKAKVAPQLPPVKSEDQKLNVVKGISEEQQVFTIVEELPEFPGGSYALKKWVNSQVEKYNLKGKAKIGFTVNAQGNVTDVKIVEKDDDQLGRAGAEIINKMPRWKSGKQRGKAVPVKYLMDIDFS